MPEGPEVRKYADAIDRTLCERAIVSLEARTKDARKEKIRQLRQKMIRSQDDEDERTRIVYFCAKCQRVPEE